MMAFDQAMPGWPFGTPWKNEGADYPGEIYEPKGMITPNERRLLFWLARNHFTGGGAIIDGGAFVGSSAFSLASGLTHRPASLAEQPYINSFDYFRAMDDYVVQEINKYFNPIALGDSYLHIFKQQVNRHLPYIKIWPGDLAGQRWTGEPIEILFLDICKSLELNSYVIRTFFPYLIPGHSVIVHQDFYHPWHPYIHYSMQFLKSRFEIIDDLVGQSRAFLLRERIPSSDLERAAADAFTSEEKIRLLTDLRDASRSPMREMAAVSCLHQLQRDLNWEGFDAARASLTAHPDFEANLQQVGQSQPWVNAALRMFKNSERQRDI